MQTFVQMRFIYLFMGNDRIKVTPKNQKPRQETGTEHSIINSRLINSIH